MTSTLTALETLLSAQGRSAREGQITAANAIDAGNLHTALQAPTGVGKSALAVAASLAAGKGVIAIHSNGLIAQYMAEAPEWEAATGKTVVALVGMAHYWCKKASPDLVGFTAAQKDFVRTNGTFIGAGVEQSQYKLHSVAGVVRSEEEEEEEPSPCTKCDLRGGCPLWAARQAAADADVVVTNATMLGVALGGGTGWAKNILKDVIVLDEAHADAEPIATVLGAQITIGVRRGISEEQVDQAAAGLSEALSVVFEWAGDEDHFMVKKARTFLARYKEAKAAGQRITHNVQDGKVILTILVDLVQVFKELKVIAMSATLSQRNVKDLGLDATVINLAGLDVSASTVFVQNDAPRWAWSKGSVDQQAAHAEWATHVAGVLAESFDKGGALLGLFVSRDDLEAVVKALPAHVRAAALPYYSGVDRTKTIEIYKANPTKHLIVGCVSGAGTGVNLPGDLLRTVVVSRVPQNAPRGVDNAKWAEDTRAAVVQSVGRAHRHQDDWGHIKIVGGFGARGDVRKSLDDLGWVLK